MPHNKVKNGVLNSHSVITNPETGEYFEIEHDFKKPDSVPILDKNNGFYKVRDGFIDKLEPKLSGYLLQLIHKNLDYNTGRLRIGEKGKNPKPITTINQISEILHINRKTARKIIQYAKKEKVLLKIGKYYHANPRFIQYGKYIETETFLKMIELDPILIKHVPFRIAQIVGYYRKVG